MATYRAISLDDYEIAITNFDIKKYRAAVFYFQQFAEKSAKALLERIDPQNRAMRSHLIERILEAYDPGLEASDIVVKAVYISSFYYNTRYPGDNYVEVKESQAKKVKQFACDLESYFQEELKKLDVLEKATPT